MSTQISDGTTTVTPDVVDGFNSTRDTGIRVHVILGRDVPDITYQTGKLRTGTLRLIFADETESATAEDLHISGAILTMVSSDRTAANFSYVATSVMRELDDETRDVWIVEVEYQEVA